MTSPAALDELRAAARAARRAGDIDAELAARRELVVGEAALGRTEEAKKHARAAEVLARDAGREADAAEAAYAAGLLEARVPEAARQAERTLERALAGFQAAGDPIMAGRTLGKLAALAGAREDFPLAAERLDAAAQLFVAAGDARRELEARRLQALVLVLGGRSAEGYARMGDAVALAGALGLEEVALALRLDRVRLFADDPTAPLAPGETRERIVADARAAGVSPSAGELVDEAGALLRAGRAEEGLASAEAACDAAMDAIDPVGYLLACLVRFEAHEQLDARVRALGSLFECQANLAALLGDEARAPVLAFIESLPDRWGEAAFDAALLAHRGGERGDL